MKRFKNIYFLRNLSLINECPWIFFDCSIERMVDIIYRDVICLRRYPFGLYDADWLLGFKEEGTGILVGNVIL